MKARVLLLALIGASLLLHSVTAQVFPSSYEGEAGNTTIYPPLYTIPQNYVSLELWALITGIGVFFLTLSVLFPERGELTTGVLAFLFLTPSMLLASFVGVVEVADLNLIVEGGTWVLQPIVILHTPGPIPWMMIGVWIVSVVNVMLGILNFLLASTRQKREGMM